MTLPGIQGVEHLSFTVPDLAAAESFFVDVLGAAVTRRARYGGSAGEGLGKRFNAHPDATAELVKVDLAGTPIELFEYHAPDLATDVPRNCDAGGHHVALAVVDVDAVVAELRLVPGVVVLSEPATMRDEHGRLRRWVYALTPWGLQLELASTAAVT